MWIVEIIPNNLVPLLLLRHHGGFVSVHRNRITTAAAAVGVCQSLCRVRLKQGPSDHQRRAAQTDREGMPRKHFSVGFIVHVRLFVLFPAVSDNSQWQAAHWPVSNSDDVSLRFVSKV